MRALATIFLTIAMEAARLIAQESAPASAPTTGSAILPAFAEIVDLVLDAYRTENDEKMDALALVENPDCYIVVNILFQRQVTAMLDESRGPDDYLDAAHAFAHRAAKRKAAAALPGLVETLKSLSRQDLETDAAIHAILDPAIVANRAGRLDEAIDGCRRACAISVRSGSSITAALARNYLANTLQNAKRLPEAIAAFRAQIEAADQIGWLTAKARALNMIASMHDDMGEMEKALEVRLQELAVLEQMDDEQEIAECKGCIGDLLCGRGEYSRAMELYKSALKVFEARGDPWWIAMGRKQLADVHTAMGQYSKAIELLEPSVAAFDKLAAAPELADATAKLSQAYQRMGDHKRGLEYAYRCRAAYESLGRRVDVLHIDAHIGWMRGGLGEPAEAIEMLRADLDEARTLNSGSEEDDLLAAMGAIYTDYLDDPKSALPLFERVLEIAKASGKRAAIASASDNLAASLLALGEHDRAAVAAEEARAGLAAIGDRGGEAHAERNLAVIERRRGNYVEALHHVKQVLAAEGEFARGLGQAEAIKVRSEVATVAPIGFIATLRLLAERPEAQLSLLSDNFAIAESARALLLTEGMVNREALTTARVPAALRTAADGARAAVARARRELVVALSAPDPDPVRLASLRGELEKASKSFDDTIARLDRGARRTAAVVWPTPITLAAYRALLPADTAFVSWQIDEERTMALVVTRDGASLHDLVPTAGLQTLVESLLALLCVDGTSWTNAAARAYDALVRPIESVLAGRSRLLVCVDPRLAVLPMEVLLRAGEGKSETMLERFEIVYVPSATVHAMLTEEARATPRGTVLVALGDPVYPGEGGTAESRSTLADDATKRGFGRLSRLIRSADEVKGIGEMFAPERRRILMREAATVDGLRAAIAAEPASRLAALHLACHGMFSATFPELSGLVLAHGEMLGVDDVYTLVAQADLAVLSACETGQGAVSLGEGVLGLVRAFFHAGCLRVVVTDWSVSDESTKQLMVDFYGRMLKGASASSALRAAKLALLRAVGAHAHPFHWAAPVLWGI